MKYVIRVITILGKSEITFPDTEWNEPCETQIEHQGDSSKLVFNYFFNAYGVGVTGVRFNPGYCSPVDVVRTLEVNETYHRDPSILAWAIVEGEAHTGGEHPITESLADAAREATGHEDATKAMKDAGNYKKGRCRLCGFDVVIEQPAGSYREGVDPDGTPWKTRMNHHYGALLKTAGADGDHVDAFFNPDVPEDDVGNMPIFVVDQVDKEGVFDEHKALFGFTSKAEAKAAYLSNYEDDWEGLGDIHQMDLETFREWVTNKAKTKKAVNPVFEAAGDWRERIMAAKTFEEIEAAIKSIPAKKFIPFGEEKILTAEDLKTIEKYGLKPEDLSVIVGNKVLTTGKIRVNDGNWHATLEEALVEHIDNIKRKERYALEDARREKYEQLIADKLRNGESPTFEEWKELFPDYRRHFTYVKQGAISGFLVKYFGFSPARIKKPLGSAAGNLISDMGGKTPIVYLDKLAAVLGKKTVEEFTKPDNIESSDNSTKGDNVKILKKLRKADTLKKTDIWQDLNLNKQDAINLVRDMVLTVPKGHYKLHDRQYGTNLVDTVWEMYGWMPSMFVNEPMMLGLQATHPEKVYASFTLGLDAVQIK